eukprot:TRINITY_DN24833_c0_g1_i1.p1 TRINITY_DN24833_c0_g1~~TRINITY_DN24833_c0_g1_i1.p1  ORF type:complete len:655 (+),score=140.67 TRINITY_DN24833_c0_g1_i1:88-1965(+)
MEEGEDGSVYETVHAAFVDEIADLFPHLLVQEAPSTERKAVLDYLMSFFVTKKCGTWRKEDEEDDEHENEGLDEGPEKEYASSSSLLGHRLREPELFLKGNYPCKCCEPCVEKFSDDDFASIVHSLRILPWIERKRVATTILWRGFTYPDDEEIVRTDRLHGVKKRRKTDDPPTTTKKRRAFMTYAFGGISVCRNVFVKVMGMSDNTLISITRKISEAKRGLPFCIEKRGGSHHITQDKKMKVLFYLQEIGRRYGYPCPSTNPCGGKLKLDQDIIVLPSRVQFRDIHESFCKSEVGCEMSYRHFRRLWNSKAPWLRIAKTGSEFCNVCTKLLHEKQNGFEDLLSHHLSRVRQERMFYREIVERTIQSETKDSIHLTFDFAEAVRLPCDAKEPEFIVSKSGFLIHLFGIVNETNQHSALYIIPEGDHPHKDPKNADCVISFLMHYLDKHVGPSIRHLFLHADNCSSQNKNCFLLAWCSYLVQIGRFDSITYAFLIAGHTKCPVDGLFGAIRRRLGLEICVGTTDEFIEAIRRIPENIDVVDTTFNVVWHEWREFFSQFKPFVPFSSRRHVFIFDKQQPVLVNAYDFSSNIADELSTQDVVFQDGIGSCALMNPSEHGFKDKDEFLL